ncbi:MAG: ferritin family protein [Thermoplasmatales archaeon]|nr:MAG: ferritin family protein [Thermoplasmatales archaeon]
MDLSGFDLEELLLAAIKSEIESNKLYLKMSKKTKNGLLEDKLKFLANEEEKHRIFVEDIYKNHYPENKIVLPRDSPVPLPEVNISEDLPLSILLKEAMNAEQSASDFYRLLAGRFEEGTKLNNTLLYFSDMEKGHYKLLETEKESMERFEEGDIYWPMVHVGP